MTRARAKAGLLVVVLAGWCSLQETFAEPARKVHRTTPAHPAKTAPDITGAITKSPQPVALPPQDESDDGQVPPPFKLPAATRARVRACGAAWRDMKLAGTTGDEDWRDFALKCFVGKGSTALAD